MVKRGSINGLGFYDSDIDLYLEVPKDQKRRRNGLLYRTRAILSESLLSKYYDMMVIGAAKCPIVKVTNKSTKVKLLEFDINATHSIGVFNSMVLSYLVNADCRLRQLFAIVKFWAKLNDLIDVGIFRSYTFALLVIFFLQDGEVSYIKPLDSLYEYSQDFHENVLPDFENELKPKCLDLLANMDQIPSTLTLIHQFFAFYSSFDFMNFVISLRLGFAVRKDHYFQLVNEFDDLGSHEFRLTSLICLEDPFELDRNLTGHFKEAKFEQFVRLCTWYAKKPSNFFYNGSNFARFISLPCKSVVMPVNALKYICPCVCILRKCLQQKSASDTAKRCHFIMEFAKLAAKSVVDRLGKPSADGKKDDKYEIVRYTFDEDCFQELIKAEEDALPQNVIAKVDRLQSFNVANIQLKLLKQVTQESVEKSKKRRKQNLTVDGNEAKLLYEPSTVAAAANAADAADGDCRHPLVNATLQCRFISEKNYLFSFKYDQLPPKWLISKLVFAANSVPCGCKEEAEEEKRKVEEKMF
ncbi:hypothetical protein TYRP_005556 [Tyrophagus putrescentiae]|nr:hypothetical protein TYRP_005556 [Tyrophagus putrescentiae]